MLICWPLWLGFLVSSVYAVQFSVPVQFNPDSHRALVDYFDHQEHLETMPLDEKSKVRKHRRLAQLPMDSGDDPTMLANHRVEIWVSDFHDELSAYLPLRR